jgi:hypothetical protein
LTWKKLKKKGFQAQKLKMAEEYKMAATVLGAFDCVAYHIEKLKHFIKWFHCQKVLNFFSKKFPY